MFYREEVKGSFLFLLFLLVLLLYIVNDMVSFRVGYVNKALFVLLSLFSVLYFVSSKRQVSQYLLALAVCLWVLFSIFINVDGYGGYVYTDAFLIISVVFFYFVVGRNEKFLLERWAWYLFWACLLVFFLIWILGLSRVNGRFPSISPYVYSIFLVVYADRLGLRNTALISLLVLALIFFSGDRTALIIGAFLVFLVFLKDAPNNKGWCFVFACFFIVALAFFGENLTSAVSQSRISSISNIENDYSAMQRVYEVTDVLHYLVEDYRSGGWKWFFGFGSGATFVPIESWSARNILDDGSVHHIHATPFVVLYRYGVWGLLLWCCFLFFIAVKAWKSSVLRGNILYVGVFICMLLDQMLRNVLVNPMFFVVASYIIISSSRRGVHAS